MPSSLPRWPAGSDSLVGRPLPTVSLFASGGGLPRLVDGSATTLDISRPAQRSLALRPAWSPGRLAARCLEAFDGFVTSTAAPIATGWSDPVAGWELHPLKKHGRTASVPQDFTRPVARPTVSVSAWLALADWFQHFQRRVHGGDLCGTPHDRQSPPISRQGRSTALGPDCLDPLADAASDPSSQADSDRASPPARVLTRRREGGRP